jgi:hypothetical protein
MKLYNLSEAGREIGIGRNTLCEMLREVGIFGKGNVVKKYLNKYFIMQTVRKNNKPFTMPLVSEEGLEYLKKNLEYLKVIPPEDEKTSSGFNDDDLILCLTKAVYKYGCLTTVNLMVKWGTKDAEDQPIWLFRRWRDLKNNL